MVTLSNMCEESHYPQDGPIIAATKNLSRIHHKRRCHSGDNVSDTSTAGDKLPNLSLNL